MMKCAFSTCFFALGCVCWNLPASAIEGPSDNAPPPAAKPDAAPTERPAQTLEAAADSPAYLGVVTCEVPKMLSAHVDLPDDGSGILVRDVMPEGPAAKAGLVQHDILTRFNGKPLTSPADLTQQIRAQKPGDTIHLNLIHHGKAKECDVALGNRPDGVAMNPLPPIDDDRLPLDGIPPELADRVRGAIQGNLGNLDLKFDHGLAELDPQFEQMQKNMHELQERMNQAMKEMQDRAGPAKPKPGLNIHQGATLRMMDEQGSLEIRSNDGSKEVTVRDKDDKKIIWSGPWDTEQDKAAAPEDVRQRIERLNLDMNFKGNGLRLNLNGGHPGP